MISFLSSIFFAQTIPKEDYSITRFEALNTVFKGTYAVSSLVLSYGSEKEINRQMKAIFHRVGWDLSKLSEKERIYLKFFGKFNVTKVWFPPYYYTQRSSEPILSRVVQSFKSLHSVREIVATDPHAYGMTRYSCCCIPPSYDHHSTVKFYSDLFKTVRGLTRVNISHRISIHILNELTAVVPHIKSITATVWEHTSYIPTLPAQLNTCMARLSQLTTIRLQSDALTDACMAAIVKANPNITDVDVSRCGSLTDAAIGSIGTLMHLARINMSNGFFKTNKFTLACFQHLSRCLSLRKMYIIDFGDYSTQHVLSEIANTITSQLQELYMDSCWISPGEQTMFRSFPELRVLSIGRASSNTLSQLAETNPLLEKIDMMACPILVSEIDSLVRFRKLKVFRYGLFKHCDEVKEELEKLKKRTMHLQNVKIDYRPPPPPPTEPYDSVR